MTPSREAERVRWWIFNHFARAPGICVSNLYDVVFGLREDDDYSRLRKILSAPRCSLVDDVCRSDCERVGYCYCGKLRAESPQPDTGETR